MHYIYLRRGANHRRRSLEQHLGVLNATIMMERPQKKRFCSLVPPGNGTLRTRPELESATGCYSYAGHDNRTVTSSG